MKKIWFLGGTAIILVLAGLFLYGCGGASGNIGGASTQQTGIWVTGEGKVEAAPDIVSVQLGIVAQAKTVGDAQAQANAAMSQVMNALKDSGVADKDIQTRYFNIQKVTRWDNDTQQEITIGFSVTNQVIVKIRDVPKAGSIIDSVVQAGGDLTRIDSINFSIDDPIAYYDQARKKAVADARDKATRLAALAGVKLGKPNFISEYGTPSVQPPSPISSKATADSAGTQISPGELEITLSIQVVYAIR